jgi:hypothetical protein
MANASFPLMRHYHDVDSLLSVLERCGHPTSKWTLRSWLYRTKRIPEQHWWCFCVDLQNRGIFFTPDDFVRP